jgi:ribosomal protein L44E
MCQFEEIIDQLIDAGEVFSDQKRIAAFQNGIERGSIGPKGKSLSDDIHGMVRMKFTYNDIVHEIQRIVNVDLMRKKEISFQQSQMPRVVNAVGRSKTKPVQKAKPTTSGKKKDVRHCTNCGMDGHLAEKCWKDEICTGCGGLGHIEAFCSSKEKSKSSSSSSSSSATPVPKVNLPKLFVDKNPAK